MNSPTWMYFVLIYEYKPRERPSHYISTNNLCESVQVSHHEIKRKCAFFQYVRTACAKYVTKIANFQRRTLKSLKINVQTAKNQVDHTFLTILFLVIQDIFL